MASDTLYYSWITPDLDRNLVIQSKYLPWSITISYIMFAKLIGPRIMKNRKPMNLQYTMLLHNFLLVACNAFLAAHKFYYLGCFGLFLKFLELFDTVIFILRKKFQQVSFLHVFHHAIIFFLFWMALKFQLIGYYVLLFGAVNCSVHVALYLHYSLTALGPGVRKYLWWRKYLTTIEIVQVFAIMTYMTYSVITGCDEYSKFDNIVFAAVVTVAALFIHFYIRKYITADLLR